MRRGFTLLELVIVIIVIGTLVAMALPQFTSVVERGRVAKCKIMLDMYRKAEGIRHAIKSVYTNVLADLRIDIPELAANDGDWSYVITSADATSFLITATRLAGQYIGKTITINQLGQDTTGDHPLR